MELPNVNNSKNIALMAITAAIYVVLSILPGIVVAPNVSIQFEAGFASVIGFLLGPYLGFLTALVASSVAWVILNSGIFGLPFLFNPPINALIVGLILYKNRKTATALSVLLYGVLIIIEIISPPLWPLTSYWDVAILVLWDKLIGLALVFPAVILYNKYKQGIIENKANKLIIFTIFFMVALIGNILDNLLGVVVFSYPPIYSGVYGLTLDTVRFLFVVNPFIYLPIRIAQAIFAAVIIVGLVRFTISQLSFPNRKSLIDSNTTLSNN